MERAPREDHAVPRFAVGRTKRKERDSSSRLRVCSTLGAAAPGGFPPPQRMARENDAGGPIGKRNAQEGKCWLEAPSLNNGLLVALLEFADLQCQQEAFR